MPLNIFIDILCDEKFELLGEAPIEELKQVFDEIIDQYNNAIGGDDVKAKMNKIIKIYILESKITRATTIINVLRVYPNEDLFNQIFKFGYNLPNYKYSKENIINLIDTFQGYVKRDSFELQGIIEDLGRTTLAVTKDNCKRENFIDMIISLCDHYDIMIDENSITVEKYCGFIKKYMKDVERLLSNQNKK